jgi:hypothetical protein
MNDFCRPQACASTCCTRHSAGRRGSGHRRGRTRRR